MSNSSLLRNATSTNGSASDFHTKLGELRTLLADLAKSAPAAASETFDDLKDKASSLRDSCTDKSSSMRDACTEKVSDASQAVLKTVKEHPAQVALAAVGAGLLTWWLLSRSTRSAE